MVKMLDRFMEWHLGPLQRLMPRRPRKPFDYREAELRLKELRTMLFFLITGYFALIAGAVFS